MVSPMTLLQKSHLTIRPLISFGADAVERFFMEEQIEDVLSFAEKLDIGR